MKVTRSRIGAGLIIIAAIAIAPFLKGLGVGSGDGIGDGDASNSTNAVVQISDDADIVTDPSVSQPPVSVQTEPDLTELVQVIIDERSLYLATDSTSPEKVREQTLEEIVLLVKAASGNSQGIQSRIYRTPQARASIEADLLQALKKEGIQTESIQLIADPLK